MGPEAISTPFRCARHAGVNETGPRRLLLLTPLSTSACGPENQSENNALGLASAVVEPSYVGFWVLVRRHEGKRPAGEIRRPQPCAGREHRVVALNSTTPF